MTSLDIFKLTDVDHIADAKARFVRDPETDCALLIGNTYVMAGRIDGITPGLLIEAPDGLYVVDSDLHRTECSFDGAYDLGDEF
jgi:hypothetical protein